MADREPTRASRYQEQIVGEFRANSGKVGGWYVGLPLLLLTTTGARSGERRAAPLTYLPDGGRYVVAAANAGARSNPAWYHNLIANPEVTVEVGTETFAATATVAAGREREALYRRCAAEYPQLAHYQAMTTREIPMVVIARSQQHRADRAGR
jgi:deazaflavin-dependent oxidoreductase (nitroreductase family)